ncbi:amidohydrolase [Orbus hercynius]|uniref:Amidohydrolase n=1 Tax=Orbus hercynius TaxID=593135 RepID=A0A495REE9_9GAMM|nr:amidohydrolase [Orbus hercynius]RKS85731.1 amidohydrolase [Orbus hercynius]
METINTLIESVKHDVITWRRHIHQYPDLTFNEQKTANYIYEQLTQIDGLTLSRPTPTSVTAYLQGAQAGKTIALRGDIDALPITECSGEAFSSTNPGVMHACGHDAHAAMLLGAAKVLAQVKSQIKGNVLFIFQPAEEVPPGGAKELVEKGVLNNVDMIFGLHVFPTIETGKVSLKRGVFSASSDNFDITIKGVGGHGSMPQLCIDPVVIGAEIVTALQQIVARNLDPLHAPVLTVATFQAGDSYNVIPTSAHLAGTLRTHNKDVRQKVPQLMERIIAGITQAHGASYEFKWTQGYTIGNNAQSACDVAEQVITKVVGADNLIMATAPMFGSEDFSSYQEKVPGCFLFMGSGNKEKGATAGLHNAKFILDEDVMDVGVKMHVGFIQNMLMS